MSKFEKTFCSQCGKSFGPGDSGYSHCHQHRTSEQNRAIMRDELIELIARAWAKHGALESTLEETFDRRKILAGRFTCSGEAAAIADAVMNWENHRNA